MPTYLLQKDETSDKEALAEEIFALFSRIDRYAQLDDTTVHGEAPDGETYHIFLEREGTIEFELGTDSMSVGLYDWAYSLGIPERSDLQVGRDLERRFGKRFPELHKEWARKRFEKEAKNFLKWITPIFGSLVALPGITKFLIGDMGTFTEEVIVKKKKGQSKQWRDIF